MSSSYQATCEGARRRQIGLNDINNDVITSDPPLTSAIITPDVIWENRGNTVSLDILFGINQSARLRAVDALIVQGVRRNYFHTPMMIKFVGTLLILLLAK